MSIASRMNSQFPDIASFAAALSAGVIEEIAPFQAQIDALRAEIVQLRADMAAFGVAVTAAAADAAAASAASAAAGATATAAAAAAATAAASAAAAGSGTTPPPAPSPAAVTAPPAVSATAPPAPSPAPPPVRAARCFNYSITNTHIADGVITPFIIAVVTDCVTGAIINRKVFDDTTVTIDSTTWPEITLGADRAVVVQNLA